MQKLKETSERVMLRIDAGTYGRIKTLSGDLPMARYLRMLFGELAKDTPPSLDDLAGGYSLLPLRRQLDYLGLIIQELVGVTSEALEDNKTIVEAIKAECKDRQDNFTQAMSLGILTVNELDKRFPGIAAAIDKQLPGFVASAKEAQGQLRTMKEHKDD